MKNDFWLAKANPWTGAAIAVALAFATVSWAAPGSSSSSDPTPYATPSVNAPMNTTDTNQPTAQQAAPCPVSDTAEKSDKKDKHDNDKKDKHDKKSEESIDDVEPGTSPVNCDHPGANFDPDKVVGVGSDMEKVKPGSVEDVSAVGNRDIGKRGLGNWYSVDGEIKMGKQYADQVDKSARFITDPVIDEYVNRIGQNIVKNSDCKVPFTIKVIDSDEINAFALPGGFFYVNSGLILAADEEAELAGVMAHETAHVCAHHAAREMTRMQYAQLGMIPLMIFTGYTWTGYGIYEAAQLAIPITFLQFSRDFEAQADYLGIQYMYRAGYDPQAMISFFEKVEALQKRKPGLVSKAFSDHPQTPDRIVHSQEEIARILPAKDEYLVTTSEFSDVKARLARIENRRRLTDANKNKNAPSLRRANPNPNGGDTTGSGTDTTDHPTLHRRDDNGNGGQN
ncbi:MAG: M48 family metallopeptidase [Terracidiphilus sp.]